MAQPTLSVLLPAFNECSTPEKEARFRRQLASVVSQLGRADEIILLDDGSTDATGKIMDDVAYPGKIVFHRLAPAGVCEAYNICNAYAGKSWRWGQSGNDMAQPGTVDAWRQAATGCPHARVMFGDIANWGKLNFTPSPNFVPASVLPAIFKRERGFRTHGAAAFIRGDSWGRGYIPEIGHMADWYQTLVLAMRHGFYYLRHTCSKVAFGADQFSADHADDVLYNMRVDAMRREWNRPENDDIRDAGETLDKVAGWLTNREAAKTRGN